MKMWVLLTVALGALHFHLMSSYPHILMLSYGLKLLLAFLSLLFACLSQLHLHGDEHLES